MVQATFTKQKRALGQAAAWIERLRAQEVRLLRFDNAGATLEERKEAYVDFSPEEIASKVLGIVSTVVSEHGARQRANGQRRGAFEFRSVRAELTVPQLRALKEAHATLATLVQRLPRKNPKVVPNGTVDGRPAFFASPVEVREIETTVVPYEEKESTRIRTYDQRVEKVVGRTQRVEVDYGLDARVAQSLDELVADFGTSIQVAIDEANSGPAERDPVIDAVIEGVRSEFEALLPRIPTETRAR